MSEQTKFEDMCTALRLVVERYCIVGPWAVHQDREQIAAGYERIIESARDEVAEQVEAAQGCTGPMHGSNARRYADAVRGGRR